MSIMQSPQLRGTSDGRGRSPGSIQVPFTPEFSKTLTRSSPRFGSLSHHSFFSRHNPHPHRVRHIQGLNGRPVCTVRDDWFVTSSLFPHPLLKSHVHRKAADASFALPLARSLNGAGGDKNKSALFSEAWRDELKELAAKVSLSPQKDKKQEPPEEEYERRKTQYSSETGRIIPPPTVCRQRRSHSQHRLYPQPFHDQELMVLEILCQILQTDSLSTVQQWLLLAGQREKELVKGMIGQALDGVDVSAHHHQLQSSAPPVLGPSPEQMRPQRTRSLRLNRSACDDKPVRMGEAEVLEIHTGNENPGRDDPLQKTQHI